MSRSREDPVAAELAVVGYDPRQYLQEYFLQLNEEYEGLYRFWCSAVAGLPAGGRALELGVGPTLYSAICLAERFSEIHLADFVDKSLVEIRRWLEREPGSFDWGPHVRLVLRTEGRAGTSEEVAAREARLRAVITRLLPCDLRRLPPLRDALPYDLVSAHYCTEAAAADTGEWAMTVANAGSLVRPGGCFLLSVSTGLTLCRVYDSEPPHASPAVGEELLREALAGAGMDMDSAVIEFLKAPAGRPYRGTFLASVTKRS